MSKGNVKRTILDTVLVLLTILGIVYRFNIVSIPGLTRISELSETSVTIVSLLVLILMSITISCIATNRKNDIEESKKVAKDCNADVNNGSFNSNFIEKLMDDAINRNEMKAKQKEAESAESSFETEKPNVTFDDVIGLTEAKKEMRMIVDYLRDPQKYKEAGAECPSGVLLYGEPGTGKTLLAKAVAGEASLPVKDKNGKEKKVEVNFISKGGASFTDTYVGVGPKNIRNLFAEAKKLKPCIVFIDEIDALGKSRDSHTNSEDGKTINEFLTQVGGLGDSDGIVVIGATNKIDELDSAFQRSGRFDLKICVPVPETKEEVLEVIKYYAKNKKFYEDVDFKNLAKEMLGCSPADIKTVLNKAALEQVFTGKKAIDKELLEKAFTEFIIKGHVNETNKKSQKDKELVAYHEAGHAIMGKMFGKDITKVTIVSTTSGAGGFTQSIPEEKSFKSKRDFKNEIMELYGGRAAEWILLGDEELITAGCSNDIERSTKYIRNMITRFGMSNRSPLIVIDKNTIVDSDITLEIYNEMTEIAKGLYQDTITTLEKNKDKLENLAKALLEFDTLTGDDIDKAINGELKREETNKIENETPVKDVITEALEVVRA